MRKAFGVVLPFQLVRVLREYFPTLVASVPDIADKCDLLLLLSITRFCESQGERAALLMLPSGDRGSSVLADQGTVLPVLAGRGVPLLFDQHSGCEKGVLSTPAVSTAINPPVGGRRTQSDRPCAIRGCWDGSSAGGPAHTE